MAAVSMLAAGVARVASLALMVGTGWVARAASVKETAMATMGLLRLGRVLARTLAVWSVHRCCATQVVQAAKG